MDAYRAGIAYGYFMWAITLVVKPADHPGACCSG